MLKSQKKINFKPFTFITSIIFNLVTIFLVIVGFVLITTNYSHSIPKMFNYMIINVTSGSMSPTYEKGDIVVIRKVQASELKVGDVIAFYRYEEKEYSSIIWFHRIVEIKDDENGELLFLTQGDANRFPDAKWSKPNNIIGVNGESCNLINKLVEFLISVQGIIFLVIIPASYIFLYEFVILLKLLNETGNKEGENYGRKKKK